MIDEDFELDCTHEPRRLHDCPRCRSAVLEDVTP